MRLLSFKVDLLSILYASCIGCMSFLWCFNCFCCIYIYTWKTFFCYIKSQKKYYEWTFLRVFRGKCVFSHVILVVVVVAAALLFKCGLFVMLFVAFGNIVWQVLTVDVVSASLCLCLKYILVKTQLYSNEFSNFYKKSF